jgi:hypothetical protein
MRGLKLAWHTGLLSIRIESSQSGSRQAATELYRDSERVLRFYHEPVEDTPGPLQRVSRALAWRTRELLSLAQTTSSKPPAGDPATPLTPPTREQIAQAFRECDILLREADRQRPEILDGRRDRHGA